MPLDPGTLTERVDGPAARPARISPRFWASVFYACYFAGSAGFGPFLALYYQQIGLPMASIGILMALPTAMTLVASPLWAGIADYFNLHRWLLPITIFSAIPLAWLIYFNHSFVALIGCILMFAFVVNPILPLGDYATLSLLGDRRNEYGRIRLWGAVGYGLSAWVSGLLIEHGGIQIGFLIFTGMQLINGLVTTRLPAPRLVRREPFTASLRSLTRDRRWQSFLLAIFLIGLSFSAFNSYLVLHMKFLGAGEGTFGLAIALAGIGELPVFFLSSLALKRWAPRHLLVVSFGVMVVRCLLVGFITNPYLMLATQFLHGLTFSLTWTAGVTYANEIAPPGLGASVQALFGAVFFGLGNGLGSLMGSGVLTLANTAVLFRLAGLVAFFAFGLLVMSNRQALRKMG